MLLAVQPIDVVIRGRIGGEWPGCISDHRPSCRLSRTQARKFGSVAPGKQICIWNSAVAGIAFVVEIGDEGWSIGEILRHLLGCKRADGLGIADPNCFPFSRR